jgi:DnaA N-terminal domain
MQLPRPVGREAASRKYDILSALMAFALSRDKHVQKQILRIMALITTRYNWQRDELTMGQGEIARLWSVDERTVKREMARLRAQGWLVLKRQGARGRVSVYGMDLNRMVEDTRPAWPLIGEDFTARLEPGESSVGQGASNVVPLRIVQAPAEDGTVWALVQAALCAEDAATYGAWFRTLTEAGMDSHFLTLAAPTRFHATYVATNLKDRLLAALKRVEPSVRDVRIIS